MSDGSEGKPQNFSRREFVKATGLGAVASSLSRAGFAAAAEPAEAGEMQHKLWDGQPGVFHTYPAPRGAMVYRGDGSVILFSVNTTGKIPPRQALISHDDGHTWGKPFTPKNEAGGELVQNFQAAMRLQSGKIGLVTGGEEPPFYFQTSTDGGQTFSKPATLVPGSPAYLRDVQHRNQLTQLSSGRLVFPVYSWAGRTTDIKGLADNWKRGAPWCWTGMCYSYAYFSDDEGRTWDRSANEVTILLGLYTGPYCGFADFEEPTSIELKDGRLVLIGRNRMGRLFHAFSTDNGVQWGVSSPTELTASYGPASIRRIPTTGDLLICWNQVSKQEIIDGLDRHRLSVAISTDEGQTWGNFKNLYSLDDYNYVRPEPPQIIVPGEQWVKRGLGKVDDRGDVGLENVYVIPKNSSRYYRKPASARTGYPMVCITDKNVLVSYEMGMPIPISTALDVFPIDWLYQPIMPKGPYGRLIIDGNAVKGADITIEDGTPFGWADVMGSALGDFEPPPKHMRVPVASFLKKYGITIPAGGWHPSEGPGGTLYASREKKQA